MRCPFCRADDTRVVDSRDADEGQVIRRRRMCQSCERRFTTVEAAALTVVKRSGVLEPFSRAKVAAGVGKACQGRPVDAGAIDLLAQRVEEAVRAGGRAEVPSQEVGLAILGPLRELDVVAYLRFASVYRSFDSLDDFAKEIDALRSESPATADRPGLTHPPEGAASDRRNREGARSTSAGPSDDVGLPQPRPVPFRD